MLGLKETISDLKGWHPLEYIWLAIATLGSVGLCIYWKENPIGILSMVTNVLCVILVAKGKISNYFWGTIGVVAYAYISFNSKIYGDFMLNSFYYFPMQFIGYNIWKKNMGGKEIEKKYLTHKQKLAGTAGVISTIVIYHQCLVMLGGNATLLDATSTILSIVAMGLLTKGYADQWHLWIMVNLVSIAMWIQVMLIGEGSISALMMWIIFLGNSLFGYWKWKNPDPQPCHVRL